MIDEVDIAYCKYYTCGMDNLFISVKFLHVVYLDTRSKTMIYGVCRISGRGLSICVIQEDFTKDKRRTDRMRE